VPPEQRPFILGTRLILVGLFLILAMMVKVAWRRRRERGEPV
jgi:FtsZ-interacting cell division protein ZipA